MTQQEHLSVLNLLERLRTKHEFCFGVRSSNNSLDRAWRVSSGLCFLGNDDYIWVPLCHLSVGNKTRALGIVFNLKNRESYIELVIPHADSYYSLSHPGVRDRLMSIVNSSSDFIKDYSSSNWDRYKLAVSSSANSWREMLNQVEQFLDANIDGYISKLGDCAYTKDMMKKAVGNLLEKRSEINDLMNKCLSQIYATL